MSVTRLERALNATEEYEDPNFDEDGKALYGVPGAGTYESVSALGKSQVFESAPDVTFGHRHRKQPFISKQHGRGVTEKTTPPTLILRLLLRTLRVQGISNHPEGKSLSDLGRELVHNDPSALFALR